MMTAGTTKERFCLLKQMRGRGDSPSVTHRLYDTKLI